MAARKLNGNTVFSSDDNDVGKVKEIMLDVRSGRIAYIVLSSGGFLGMGDKLLAIPWHALTLDTQNRCFRLSISSEKIRNAPGFDKDNWPSMTDHVWAGSVHEFLINGCMTYPGGVSRVRHTSPVKPAKRERQELLSLIRRTTAAQCDVTRVRISLTTRDGYASALIAQELGMSLVRFFETGPPQASFEHTRSPGAGYGTVPTSIQYASILLANA